MMYFILFATFIAQSACEDALPTETCNCDGLKTLATANLPAEIEVTNIGCDETNMCTLAFTCTSTTNTYPNSIDPCQMLDSSLQLNPDSWNGLKCEYDATNNEGFCKPVHVASGTTDSDECTSDTDCSEGLTCASGFCIKSATSGTGPGKDTAPIETCPSNPEKCTCSISEDGSPATTNCDELKDTLSTQMTQFPGTTMTIGCDDVTNMCIFSFTCPVEDTLNYDPCATLASLDLGSNIDCEYDSVNKQARCTPSSSANVWPSTQCTTDEDCKASDYGWTCSDSGYCKSGSDQGADPFLTETCGPFNPDKCTCSSIDTTDCGNLKVAFTALLVSDPNADSLLADQPEIGCDEANEQCTFTFTCDSTNSNDICGKIQEYSALENSPLVCELDANNNQEVCKLGSLSLDNVDDTADPEDDNKLSDTVDDETSDVKDDNLSGTTDKEASDVGCGYVYPKLAGNCDDAALSGCALVVELSTQACNINGDFSIGDVQYLIKEAFVEIVAAMGTTTQCKLEQSRAFDFESKAIGAESDIAARSSYKPETEEDCEDLADICGEEGDNPQIEVSMAIGLHCGTCDELETLADEFEVFLAKGDVRPVFNYKLETLCEEDDAMCHQGFGYVFLSDDIVVKRVDASGELLEESTIDIESIRYMGSRSAPRIDCYFGMLVVLVAFSLFF
eukprot:322143_1